MGGGTEKSCGGRDKLGRVTTCETAGGFVAAAADAEAEVAGEVVDEDDEAAGIEPAA